MARTPVHFALVALLGAAGFAPCVAQAATVQVVNLDPAGEGFNDPTPAASVPNNGGETVGEQKLAVVQWAATRLGQLLYSPVPIVIEVQHDDTLFCDANGATLAAAGPSWLMRRQALVADHPDLPTWYPAALGQRLIGSTVFSQDVSAGVNPNLGASDCLDGFQWYYGLDGDPPVGTLPFVDTILHELTHGVGFTALVGDDGQVSALDPTAVSPYFAYAFDRGSNKFWWELSAQERATSSTSGLLVWAGPRTTTAANSLLSAGTDNAGHPYMYAPAQFDDGSSLSHFDPSVSPALLMEPTASGQTDVFTNDIDLGLEVLWDMGWRDPGCGNGLLEDDEECDFGTANDANANAPDECTTDCAWFVEDLCPADAAKTTPGVCGCGTADTDTDSDTVANCLDACPADPSKSAVGLCGCGETEADADGDGTPDCLDACDEDPDKTALGVCGCDVADTDSDDDDTADCEDECADDEDKVVPGVCGCGTTDADSDDDGTVDCEDECAEDADKVEPGACGCGEADDDDDDDGTANCLDSCPDDAEKTARGVCGCGESEADSDDDGALDCTDECPADSEKVNAGPCGCGASDKDRDRDGTPDCNDDCPVDAAKLTPGACGCGDADVDGDKDGVFDCEDACPNDANKTAAGECGCGDADKDSDRDGTADCDDKCPDDAAKQSAGVCGCGAPDADSDGDHVLDCMDSCPKDAEKTLGGTCGCGVADGDDDHDGFADCNDSCPDDPKKHEPGSCGCGESDSDGDGDGTANCDDECPTDRRKSKFGDCGCDVAETDGDKDGVKDCLDECPSEPGLGKDGCGAGEFGDGDADGGVFEDGGRRVPSGTQHLINVLTDGDTVSQAEIQAWLADGGDPRDLPPELVQGWVQQWAADGGAKVKIAPTLPDACQCTTLGVRSSGAPTLLAGLLAITVLGARRRRRSE